MQYEKYLCQINTLYRHANIVDMMKDPKKSRHQVAMVTPRSGGSPTQSDDRSSQRSDDVTTARDGDSLIETPRFNRIGRLQAVTIK